MRRLNELALLQITTAVSAPRYRLVIAECYTYYRCSLGSVVRILLRDHIVPGSISLLGNLEKCLYFYVYFPTPTVT